MDTRADHVDIAVVDFGNDRKFAASHALVEVFSDAYLSDGTHSVTVGTYTARTRHQDRGAVLLPCRFLHLMAHGEPDARLRGRRSLLRLHRHIQLSSIVDWLDVHEQSPTFDGLLIDACNSFSEAWQAAVVDLFRHAPRRRASKVVLIGTTREVSWSEATSFTTSFYGALLRHGLPSTPVARRRAFVDAHERACSAFQDIWSKPAPFAAVELATR